ncbi:CopG family ribbon-helix-helix protein [Thermovenabulum gondwanense]|uniref:Antitoxin EndoAI n=1 Tax=Thermovenabulum gondwanense TaxID=520767 RepID=A0A162MP05_9FIRM|nr:ribbon-helix-helix protein, CopG family [Thermovenabulum gondwanense]KYO66834.1 Antitoxin EndoAI [Thermovenabulum gondwanense]
MAGLVKITVSLPENLLRQLDGILSLENKDRSELIRDAMMLYIKEKERIRMREQLKSGYMEMADINLKIAEMGICQDIQDFFSYELRLSERE